MNNDAGIIDLKHDARHHYEQYHNIADGYDCGAELLQYMNADVARHAREFDRCMRALQELDPKFPTNWKPLTAPQPQENP